MSSARDPLAVLRQLAICLLAVAVSLSPARFVGALGAACFDCSILCPCEDEHTEGDAEADCDEHSVGASHSPDADTGHPGAPDEEQCPAECPNCKGCSSVALAALPSALTVSSGFTLATVTPPVSASPGGVCWDVFRPPRRA